MTDSERQFLIDVLIHAGLALDASHGLVVSEYPDMPGSMTWRLDNSDESALIDRALRVLGVNPSQSLPVNAISSGIGLECADRSSGLLTKQP